jgi:hypothetical protein
MKHLFDAVPVDLEAEERAWQVVRAAYAEHRPVRRRPPRVALALAALAVAVAAAALSPPGRAVVDAVRRTIGVEHASPALFRLPAAGRLLVSGPGGAWVVAPDGSKRRIGDYTEASWSPHGLFVVASTRNGIAALEPGGAVHWSLARPSVSFARWGGTRGDTRIAYLSAGVLRVVAGDGTGDRALGPAAPVAPAWRPGSGHVLAYVDAHNRLTVLDVDRNAVVSRSQPHARPRFLAWPPRGGVALVTARELVLGGRTFPFLDVRALAFSSDGRLALLRGRSVLLLQGGEVRPLFAAPGPLAGLSWSPDGRWLVTSLPDADQWVFVGRRVLAVSHIRAQLGAVSLDGWASGP